mgnify:CR=1 FL=1
MKSLCMSPKCAANLTHQGALIGVASVLRVILPILKYWRFSRGKKMCNAKITELSLWFFEIASIVVKIYDV